MTSFRVAGTCRPGTPRSIASLTALIALVACMPFASGCMFLRSNSVWSDAPELDELCEAAERGAGANRESSESSESSPVANELLEAVSAGTLTPATLTQGLARILGDHESGIPVRTQRADALDGDATIAVVPILSWRASGRAIASAEPAEPAEPAEKMLTSSRVVGLALFADARLRAVELFASHELLRSACREILDCYSRERASPRAAGSPTVRETLADPLELVVAACERIDRFEARPNGIAFDGGIVHGELTFTPDGDFLHLRSIFEPRAATEIGLARPAE